MSKRIARQRKRKQQQSKRKSKKKVVAIFCSLLTLTFAAGVVAKWKILPGISKPLALAPAPQGSFNANSPSKEYIYAGSRLLATEEPAAATATPTPTPEAISSDRINVALASNGGVATASSVASSGYPAGAANNGDRKGIG